MRDKSHPHSGFCSWVWHYAVFVPLGGGRKALLFRLELKKALHEGNIFYWSMISKSFYDMLCIKYNLKTFRGSFSGITKCTACQHMPVNAVRNIGTKISVHGCFWVLGGAQRWTYVVSLFPLPFLTFNMFSYRRSTYCQYSGLFSTISSDQINSPLFIQSSCREGKSEMPDVGPNG